MTRVSAALPRIALFLLTLGPVLTGAAILVSMRQGSLDTFTEPADLIRRASYPWAMTAHILGGTALLLLGLAQFSTRLRRAAPTLHRWTGRLLVLTGGGMALSGLWMNASTAAMPDTWLHDAAQNVAAVLLLGCLGLGLAAIRRGQVPAHRAWMMRSYALALGAGTQTLLLLPYFLLIGPPVGLGADLVFIAAWVLNLSVAEMRLRRG